jgi:hypothetical protein
MRSLLQIVFDVTDCISNTLSRHRSAAHHHCRGCARARIFSATTDQELRLTPWSYMHERYHRPVFIRPHSSVIVLIRSSLGRAGASISFESKGTKQGSITLLLNFRIICHYQQPRRRSASALDSPAQAWTIALMP